MPSKNEPANNHPKSTPEDRQMSPEEAEAYRLYLIEKNQKRFSKAAAQAPQLRCENCGLLNNGQARFCNRCGKNLVAEQPQALAREETAEAPAPVAPQALPHPGRRSKGRIYLVFAIGLVALSGLIYVSVKAYKKYSVQSQSAIASGPVSSPAATPAGESSVPATEPVASHNAELIAAAKKALADGYRIEPGYKAWGRIADARLLLEQIPSDAPEFTEAKSVMLEVERRESEKEKWDQLLARELYASNLQRTYVDGGKDTEITLAGEDKSIITFSSALMSKRLVDQMTSDPEFTRPLLQTGFKQAIFTGLNLPTWVYDVATSTVKVSGTATKASPPPVASKKPVPAKSSKATNAKTTRPPSRAGYERDQTRRRVVTRETEQNRIDQQKKREKERKKREKELKNRKGA